MTREEAIKWLKHCAFSTCEDCAYEIQPIEWCDNKMQEAVMAIESTPSGDLISRADAIKVFIDWGMKEFGYHDFNRNERFIDAINALPSADAVQGEFEICGTSNGLNGTMYYKCSLCGTPVDPSDKFCRGCGSRMKAR